MSATPEGIRRVTLRALSEENKKLLKDVVLLRGYHAFSEEEEEDYSVNNESVETSDSRKNENSICNKDKIGFKGFQR